MNGLAAHAHRCVIPIDSPPAAGMTACIDSEITRLSGVVKQAGLAGTQ